MEIIKLKYFHTFHTIHPLGPEYKNITNISAFIYLFLFLLQFSFHSYIVIWMFGTCDYYFQGSLMN